MLLHVRLEFPMQSNTPRDHWYFVGVGRDAGLQTTSLKGSKWESSILSPSCDNSNCSDEVVEKHWKVK